MPDEAIKFYRMLGLAKKAGHLAGGEFMSEKMVKEGRSKLVIVAKDASDNTKKSFTDMCTFYKTPIVFAGDKNGLGHAVGTEFRASLTIQDEGMANAIRKLID